MGTYGETPQTDIAVDAVCLMACQGNKLARDPLQYLQSVPVICVIEKENHDIGIKVTERKITIPRPQCY